MFSKYFHPTVRFQELPDDLQNALSMRFLLSVMIGILVSAIGIAYGKLILLGIAGLTDVILVFYYYFPYFLATRDLIVQISGFCIEKKTHRYMKIKMYFLAVSYDENADEKLFVCVKRKVFKRISQGQTLNIYVLPKNILPKDNGYLIIDYLFLLHQKKQLKINRD